MNVNNGRTDDDELLRSLEDSDAFIKLKNDRISYNAEILKVFRQSESQISVDASLVSQIDQDKKKI